MVNCYAAYRGDNFIDLGTAKELAKSLGIKKHTIHWLVSPSSQRRVKQLSPRAYRNHLIIIKIGKVRE